MSNLRLSPLVNVPPNTLWLSPASRGIFFGDRRHTLASGSIGSAIGVSGPYTTAAMRTAGSGVNFVGQVDNRVFTLVIQCVPTAQAIAASNYIGFTRASDGSGFIGLQTGTGTAAEFSFLSNSTRTNTGVAYEVGKPYNIVITGRRSGGTSVDLRVFINGTKVADNPSGFANSAYAAADGLAIYGNGANCQTYLAAAWADSVNDAEGRSLSLSPLGVLRSRPRQLFVPVSAGGDATGSGSFSPVSVAAPTASASGSASASGALAAITLSAPTATASAGGSASASGSFAALSISPATATATATKSATASGTLAAISLSAPTATATGTTAGGANATGTPAQITISHATAIAIGSAVASGGCQSIGITAPSATASVGNGNATATGAWAAISITAPTAYASSGFIRAPSGSGPTVIHPGGYRPSQSATSRPSNTGGRRY